MLPMNLMACRKVLVVSGPTYPTRLWCAWELLTLLAFATLKQVHGRIDILPLDEGHDTDCLVCLEEFDVQNAHCYDPNEENRLRQVIDIVGEEQFNNRIRSLASALRKELAPQNRKQFTAALLDVL